MAAELVMSTQVIYFLGHTLAGSGSEGADGAEAWAVAPFVVGATLSSGIGVMASGSSDTRCPFRVGWDDVRGWFAEVSRRFGAVQMSD